NAAFCNLARTGGEAGLQAVLAAKDTRRTVPSFAEFMQLDRLPLTPPPPKKKSIDRMLEWFVDLDPVPSRLLATRKDEHGVLWGLIHSAILGSRGDLWLAHQDGKHWTDPLFTGVNLDVGSSPSPTKTRFFGLTQAQLLRGDWFDKLVGNP